MHSLYLLPFAFLLIHMPLPADDHWSDLLTLAEQQVEQGRLTQAMGTLLQACPKDMSAESPARAPQCLQAKAMIRSLEGNHTEAIRLYERAETEWTKLAEPEIYRREQGVLAYNLGTLYSQTGRHLAAVKRLERAAAIHEQLNGANSLAAIRSLGLWGSELTTLGREHEAELILTRALALARTHSSSGSADLAIVLLRMAMLRNIQGNGTAALDLMRESEQMARSYLSPTSEEYADILLGLASLYRRAGELARAEPLLRKAIHAYDSSSRKNLSRSLTALRELGCLYAAEGKNLLAEEELTRSLRIARSLLGDGALEVALIENDLGRVFLLSPARFIESEKLLQHALGIAGTVLGPRHRDTGVVHSNLAFLNDRWRRYPEAALHYKIALEILPEPPREMRRRFEQLQKYLKTPGTFTLR